MFSNGNAVGRSGFATRLGLGLLLAGLVACSPGQSLYPKIEPDYSLRNSPAWGVVSRAYALVYDRASASGPVLAILRGGDQVKILAISRQRQILGRQIDFWFQIESEGLTCWIFGGYLERFGDEIRARYAAERLSSQLFE